MTVIFEKDFICSGFYKTKQGSTGVLENSLQIQVFRRSYESGKAEVTCPVINRDICENGSIPHYQGKRIKCPYVSSAKATRLSDTDKQNVLGEIKNGSADQEIMDKYHLTQRQISGIRSKLKNNNSK